MIVKDEYNSTMVNVSDYVTELNRIPFISRNRDYTLRTEPLQLVIAGTLRQIRSGWNNFELGKRLTIEESTTLLFAGGISKSNLIESRGVFDVTVSNYLNILRNYFIDYSTIHSVIATGSSYPYYVPVDYYSRAVVGLEWLLQKLFSIAGLTLDTTVMNEVAFYSSAYAKNVKFNELMLDEWMLYNVAQDIATYYETINLTREYYDKRPSFFDFFSEICSCFGFAVAQTSPLSFILLREAETISIGEDFRDDYESEEIEKSVGAVQVVWKYTETFSAYRSPSITELTEFPDGEGKENIPFMNNLYIFFTDEPIEERTEPGFEGEGIGNPYQHTPLIPLAQATHPSGNWNPILFKVRAKISNYVQERTETVLNISRKNVVENFIKVTKEKITSEILQETY